MGALEMEVEQVAVDPVLGAAVVILNEKGGDRAVPIWIGQVEAAAIISELRQVPMARPVTHDLLHQVIFRLRGEVARVVITDFQSGTFYAEVVLGTHEGEVRLDARPSDAIALALRANAPVFVEQHVFERALQIEAAQDMCSRSRAPRPVMAARPERYDTILANLNDDDFGKWKM
jgi:hypothetical protein